MVKDQPQHQAHKTPQYDPIPMKYAKLLPTLLIENLVQTRPPPPMLEKLQARWRPDIFCAFHQGEQKFESEHLASLGSLLMFVLPLSCSNNMIVCCFLVLQKEPFRPTRDGSELV